MSLAGCSAGLALEVGELTDAFPVVAVDHKDDSLGVLVVVAPEWADLGRRARRVSQRRRLESESRPPAPSPQERDTGAESPYPGHRRPTQ